MLRRRIQSGEWKSFLATCSEMNVSGSWGAAILHPSCDLPADSEITDGREMEASAAPRAGGPWCTRADGRANTLPTGSIVNRSASGRRVNTRTSALMPGCVETDISEKLLGCCVMPCSPTTSQSS